MTMGSMDRALTAKSQNFRQICQWTAATSLVATGTLALFSASTLNRIQHQSKVSIDLNAFARAGSISVALDRISDEQAFREEKRLIEKAAFASAEVLPEPTLAFEAIRLKKLKTHRLAKKALPLAPNALLSAADAQEIAMLERVADPAYESEALAQVYRTLRYRFVTAAEASPRVSEEILLAEEAYEYEELPEFDPSDFRVTREMESRFANFDGVPEIESAESGIEIPASEAPRVSAVAMAIDDAIQITASAPTTAREERALDGIPAGDELSSSDEQSKSGRGVPTIFSPDLDMIPDAGSEAMDSQPEVVATQLDISHPSTGPPAIEVAAKKQVNTPIPDLPKAVSGISASPQPEIQAVTVESLPEEQKVNSVPVTSMAMDSQPMDPEYAADIQAAYVDTQDDEYDSGVSQLDNARSSERTLADSVIDGDFQIYSSASSLTAGSANTPNRDRVITPAAPPALAIDRSPKNLGNGISRDAGGITIDWNAPAVNAAGIFVGKPNTASRPSDVLALTPSEKKSVEKKFSFDSAAAVSSAAAVIESAASTVSPVSENAPATDPTVDLRKCDTERVGIEAFQPASEKETLAICRRSLSLEGLQAGDQARWTENYPANEGGEHWPTLSYRKPSDVSESKPIPLLSTSSIRILTTLLRANTHSGMGIVFGEVAAGLEIKIIGRADQPIYLDGGMKVRSAKSESSGVRQFVFLNVEPGQPLLQVKTEAGVGGAIPVIVKAGMATHLQVTAPTLKSMELTLLDASSAKETRLSKLTAEIVGQPGRLAISDARGIVRLEKVAVFEDYPLYVDVTKDQKSYKNRYRVGASMLKSSQPKHALYFFSEKRITSWLAQLSGGVSKHSGLIVGVAPAEFARAVGTPSRHLKIGVLEKRSSLVPERYHLDRDDELTTEAAIRPGSERYIGVQIPEGPCVPTVVDQSGQVLWSTLIYAQPGVINVVTP